MEATVPGARPDMVTSVILHQVAAGMRPRYEQWLARIIPVAATFRGHRGVDVIRPPEGSQTYTVAIRFDDLACAQTWFQSRTRQLLIDEVEPLLAQAEQVNTVTGLEFWFDHPKGMGPPRPYKQFLLTLSVIYPLTLLVPLAVRRLIGGLPLLQPAWIERLIVAVIIVSLMTYVIMPRYTRWLAAWLRR
ncbi:antibiotic biosynthesis monooxygenase [Paucibacter sp. R3-3]|uniref:Antibiotic biosynthesis monooxygenase n=1 Tax=Roseateles agri TaxID=3098619 RepID=A0ABU5DJC8_9BURK|nr:antibiotic biosynthesis monooxygenase [Paucibacter sp. R3-3]MDY0746392.1 antibiotic biosynthesis monooxygenase [Paucibacter sp. R3-3]